ncbi:MAG: uroporphyrinogen decarboxylase [Anaerolineaceae bacterium]|nr:uroporphyrinogen decarboxylase [Anaerolineaceae bacterium]
MTEWTSRRRVEAALNHQEPDRVPTDLTIVEIPYVRLRQYLGLPKEKDLRPNRFGEVRPAPDVLEALGIDLTFVTLRGPSHWTAPEPLPDGSVLDEWGVGRKPVPLPVGGFLLEVSYSPLRDKSPDEIDLDAYPWPDPHDPGRIKGLAEEAERLYNDTDLAIMGRFGGTILEMASFMRGYEQWLMDLIRYPDFAIDLMNRITDIQIALDEAGIRAAGKYLSIFKVSGEDLGMQDRPLFSPKVWQHILRPILRRRWQAAREALDRYGASHVKILLHSDGAIREFIPDLIADGIDLIDPVQIQCKGMEPDGLKQDFGDVLGFHGAMNTQQVLPFGSPEEVKAEALRCMKTLGPQGGLILAPGHNVQNDVSPENLVALYQAVKDYGQYPLSI